MGCPDLYSIPADLQRPAMLNATPPAAGKRVRAVAPGFEHTRAYHPLYLPRGWKKPTTRAERSTGGTARIAGRAAMDAAGAAMDAAGAGTGAEAARQHAPSTERADPDRAAGRVPAPAEQQQQQLYPIIVEYMGNGPWTDAPFPDRSTGRPEDSNLGWGMGAGETFIWISMPFLSSDLGNDTEISTYWWGCPSSNAEHDCGASYDERPTLRYLHAALQQAFTVYGGDPDRVVLTGWSRGAIATFALGLHDDATSGLFTAFVPYSHLDGDCGWVDDGNATALHERWARLDGRPTLYLGECGVASDGGPAYLERLGVNGTKAVSRMEFMTTGFANHNDAWVLRNSTARAYLRGWLQRWVVGGGGGRLGGGERGGGAGRGLINAHAHKKL